jgi:hypothetical protein
VFTSLCGDPDAQPLARLQGVAMPRLAQSQCAAGQRFERADPLDQTGTAAISDSGRIIMPESVPVKAVEFSVGAASRQVELEFP